VFVYLVRQQGELTIHTDHHILGLFTKKVWEQAFWDAGLGIFRIRESIKDDEAGYKGRDRRDGTNQ